MSSQTSWTAEAVAAGATGTASTIRDAPVRTCDPAGGSCGRAGGDPVVHNDRAAALEIEAGAALPIAESPPIQLSTFPLCDRLELDGADAARPDDLLVLNSYPVLADRPHGQLRLERSPQLSHDDDVERCAQGRCHLCGDGHTSTGQPEDDGPVASETGRPHDPSQLATGVHAVAEHPHHLLDDCSLAAAPGHDHIRSSRGLLPQRQVPG